MKTEKHLYYLKLAERVINGLVKLESVKKRFKDTIEYWQWYSKYYIPLLEIKERSKQIQNAWVLGVYSKQTLDLCTEQIKQITTLTEEQIINQFDSLERYIAKMSHRAEQIIFKAMPEYVKQGMNLYNEAQHWVNSANKFASEWTKLVRTYEKNVVRAAQIFQILGGLL